VLPVTIWAVDLLNDTLLGDCRPAIRAALEALPLPAQADESESQTEQAAADVVTPAILSQVATDSQWQWLEIPSGPPGLPLRVQVHQRSLRAARVPAVSGAPLRASLGLYPDHGVSVGLDQLPAGLARPLAHSSMEWLAWDPRSHQLSVVADAQRVRAADWDACLRLSPDPVWIAAVRALFDKSDMVTVINVTAAADDDLAAYAAARQARYVNAGPVRVTVSWVEDQQGRYALVVLPDGDIGQVTADRIGTGALDIRQFLHAGQVIDDAIIDDISVQGIEVRTAVRLPTIPVPPLREQAAQLLGVGSDLTVHVLELDRRWMRVQPQGPDERPQRINADELGADGCLNLTWYISPEATITLRRVGVQQASNGTWRLRYDLDPRFQTRWNRPAARCDAAATTKQP
jgi:hypothetical protein